MEACPTRRSCAAGRSSSGSATRSASHWSPAGGSTTADTSTWTTDASAPCGRRSTTHPPPAGSSTSAPASTGASTPSPARAPVSRYRPSPTWIPASGRKACAMFVHHALSPWVGLVDQQRYAAEVYRVRSLGMTSIATAHSPLITPDSIDDAFGLLRAPPETTPRRPGPGRARPAPGRRRAGVTDPDRREERAMGHVTTTKQYGIPADEIASSPYRTSAQNTGSLVTARGPYRRVVSYAPRRRSGRRRVGGRFDQIADSGRLCNCRRPSALSGVVPARRARRSAA